MHSPFAPRICRKMHRRTEQPCINHLKPAIAARPAASRPPRAALEEEPSTRAGDQIAMSSQAVYRGGTGQRSPDAPWPVLSGLMPPVTGFYTARTETGLALADSLNPGETAVLVTADEVAQSLGPLGGTGKTQLAVAIAGAFWEQQSVDLLCWVSATGRDSVLLGYAQALADIGAPYPETGPEEAARRFLGWLARTGRPWLAVLDDLADPAVLEGLWPHGPSGRVVVTTNRPDTALRAPSPRVMEVGVFSRRESLNYLSARLNAEPDLWTGALDLATELGFLPVALAQAGAVVAEAAIDCREYRSRIAGRQLPGAAGRGGVQPAVVATTSALSLELADQLPPAGLARPALVLASLLDPNGIPGAVLTSQAACLFLARYRGGVPVDEADARTAMHNLARCGLVTIDTATPARTVRVHALVQASVRQAMASAESDYAALAAADALLQAWPQHPVPTAVDQALRDCTARLRQAAGALLWTPQCHPVLIRAGQSLDTSELIGPAIAYWQAMTDIGRPALGAAHAHTVFARNRLAEAYEAAGRPGDAVVMYELTTAEWERNLGPGHPDTLTARSNLARAYRAAGRPGDAIALAEPTLAGLAHMHGRDHPETMALRAELAQAYLAAGLLAEATGVLREVLAEREQALGPDHPDTLAVQADLADCLRAAGQLDEALPLLERTLTDWEQHQGRDHPATISARASLAAGYLTAGRHRDAIAICKRVVADRERVQGPNHPDTLTARADLADAYHEAHKLRDALALYQRLVADRERVQGPDHPDTLAARADLADAYQSARKRSAALPLYERTLADCERVLGHEHPLTQTTRESFLAAARS
jgi:tetratricopeptide (TPR) repeat protein